MVDDLKAFVPINSQECLEGNYCLLGSALSLPLVVWGALLLHSLDPLFDRIKFGVRRDPEAERFKRLRLCGSVFSLIGGVRDLVLRFAFHCTRAENLALGQVVVSVPDRGQLLSDIRVISVGCPLIWRVWIWVLLN